MVFNLLQWNARSLICNGQEFKQFVTSDEIIYHVVCVQETWLKPSLDFVLPGYVSVRKDRQDRVGGGCATFIRAGVEFRVVSVESSLEVLVVEIWSNTGRFSLINFYNPCLRLCPAELDDVLRQVRTPVIWTGDFNAHNDLWGSDRTDGNGEVVENMMYDFDLVCLNDGRATRVQLGSSTTSCLDLMIVSGELAGKGEWDVLDPHNLGSDHFPTLGSFGLQLPTGVSMSGGRFNFVGADWEKFESMCDSLLPGVQDLSIDRWNSDLTNLISVAAASAIPKKGVGSLKKVVPWWSKECDMAIKDRNLAFRKLRRFPTVDNLVRYKYCRALARRTIKSAKRNSWREYCASLAGDTPISNLWSTVKKMNGVTRKLDVPVLVVENVTAVSPAEKANLLVETFRKVHSSDNVDQDSRNVRDQSLGGIVPPQDLMCADFNVFFSLDELKRAIAKGRRTAPGLDNVHYEMLEHVSDILLEELLSLMNEIWRQGRLPKLWKHAVVIPVLKPGKDPSSPSSYRPIALTSVLCKVMERMITDRLVHFLESKGALVEYQSGFRKGRCTMDNVMALDYEVRRAFANKESLVGVFLDIERAYDMVWREGLLVKLSGYGVCGRMFEWIRNFLEERTIQVRVGQVLSVAVTIDNGTPQGSVVSPVLFNVMINDMFSALSQGVGRSLYADDGALWVRGRNVPFIAQKLQGELDTVVKWAVAWGFKISVAKSQFVVFSRSIKKWDVSLSLYGSPLEEVDCFKYLGVWFDSKLNWKTHVSKVISKTSKVLNVMRCLTGFSWGADKGTLLTIYQAMVRSVFDYGCQVYGAAATSVLRKLDVIQFKALRICCGAFTSTSSSALLVETGEKPLMLRRIQLALHYWNRLRERADSCPSSHVLEDCYEFVTGQVRSHPFLRQCMTWAKEFKLFDLDPVKCPCWGSVPTWLLPPFQIDFQLHEDKHDEVVEFSKDSVRAHIHRNWSMHLQIFTDGSKDPESGRVSCAFCVPQLNLNCGFRISDNLSVFAAEAMGILKALQWVLEARHKIVVVCSDSSSVLHCLETYHSNARPDLISSILSLLSVLFKSGCEVSFLWVPAHIGVSGNELADQCAKDSLNENAVSVTVGPGRTELRSKLMREVFQSWQLQWDRDVKGRHLYAIRPSVSSQCVLSGSRSCQVVITRLRLGHCALNSTLHLINKHRDGLCEVCRVPETISHVLLDCKQYSVHRLALVSNLSELGVTTVSLPVLLQLKDYKVTANLLGFLKASGLYARI